MAAAGLAVLGVAGCSGTETISGPDGRMTVELDDVRLVSHDSCDGLLDWFHDEGSARVGPDGLEGSWPIATRFGAAEDSSSGASSANESASAAPTAPQAGSGSSAAATSTTNTQEPGVGEPDLVWTDGARLVTVVNGSLQVVDLAAGTVTADVDLSPADGDAWPTGLLVQDDHVVVLQSATPIEAYRGGSGGVTGDAELIGPRFPQASTLLTRVDLGDAPAVVGTVEVDGGLVDARMVDGVVRAIVRSSPADLGFVQPANGSRAALDRATAANRQVVADSTLDDWLPSMTVTGAGSDRRATSTSRAVACDAVDHPASFGGFGVVTVVGLDLASGAVAPLPSAAVVADAETVYSSADALYVATTRYPGQDGAPDSPTVTTSPSGDVDQIVSTAIHAFSLPADSAARYEASGAVAGVVVDQFALSEHDGDLRIATTVPPGSWSMPMPIEDGVATGPAGPAAPVTDVVPTTSESRITVLRRDGDGLERIGEVTGLGPTEQIRGVRFAGPTAYVVTFRQTDPLFVVDLADPTAPRVAGELKIPGYSSYLQVLDPGRVLGIGQDATDRGRTTGLQESLFDVSDPSQPERVAQLVVPDASSTAETDHHALLWWPDAELLAVPYEQWTTTGTDGPRAGLLVTRVAGDAITEVGTVSHPAEGTDGMSVPPCPPDAICVAPPSTTFTTSPTPIARAVVADGRLVTVSTAGVKVSDLSTLADVSWTPLA